MNFSCTVNVTPRALLACLALAACPGAAGEQPTATDASTGADPSSTGVGPGASSTGPDTPTDPVDTADTTAATATDPAATATGAPDTTDTFDTTATTADTTTTGMDGGTTDESDTDVPACAPSWVVPDVPADLLAAHDLAWIGCELTACGPEDAPRPGEPSLLCQEFSLADVPLTYLGLMHPNDTGAFTTDDVVAPDNIAWLDGMRHTYKYGDNVYILTVTDEPADQLDVFFTVRALEVLRVSHPMVHARLIGEIGEFSAEPALEGLGWKNRLRSVIVSFDVSPLYIAAGLSILDTDPGHQNMPKLDLYSNVAAISIDRETIRGAMPDLGTKPIYDKADADENFLRYLREGLPETLVHELLHTRVDRLNSVDPDMNTLYFHRSEPNACAPFALEEALVAATSLLYWRQDGGLGDTYLDYYDVVLDKNLAIIAGCDEYAKWSQQFSMPSGVDPRYDLRILDL